MTATVLAVGILAILKPCFAPNPQILTANNRFGNINSGILNGYKESSSSHFKSSANNAKLFNLQTSSQSSAISQPNYSLHRLNSGEQSQEGSSDFVKQDDSSSFTYGFDNSDNVRHSTNTEFASRISQQKNYEKQSQGQFNAHHNGPYINPASYSATVVNEKESSHELKSHTYDYNKAHDSLIPFAQEEPKVDYVQEGSSSLLKQKSHHALSHNTKQETFQQAGISKTLASANQGTETSNFHDFQQKSFSTGSQVDISNAGSPPQTSANPSGYSPWRISQPGHYVSGGQRQSFSQAQQQAFQSKSKFNNQQQFLANAGGYYQHGQSNYGIRQTNYDSQASASQKQESVYHPPHIHSNSWSPSSSQGR